VGEVEAVVTIHSELATLPAFFADRGVREVGFRLHHDPRDLAALRLLVGLGFASEEPVDAGGASVAPREVLLAGLASRAPAEAEPAADPAARSAVSAFVRGTRGGEPVQRAAHVVIGPHPVVGDNLVAVATGIPASIVAQMVARGEVSPGVAAPEQVVTYASFFAELAGRGSFEIHPAG
jgi:saccharopine dehydrogenase-like NADP-dependent oxidoreductase